MRKDGITNLSHVFVLASAVNARTPCSLTCSTAVMLTMNEKDVSIDVTLALKCGCKACFVLYIHIQCFIKTTFAREFEGEFA